MSAVSFIVYTKAEPQGSMRAFSGKAGKVHLTSNNAKMKPYRHTVTQVARMEMSRRGLTEPMASLHQPVELYLTFIFRKAPSISKKRIRPVVKPDLDKLQRATIDALTGVLFTDDAQVVRVTAEKSYGVTDSVHISARRIEG
jgi:crossover junction endodeoxyribonuclease RusA